MRDLNDSASERCLLTYILLMLRRSYHSSTACGYIIRAIPPLKQDGSVYLLVRDITQYIVNQFDNIFWRGKL